MKKIIFLLIITSVFVIPVFSQTMNMAESDKYRVYTDISEEIAKYAAKHITIKKDLIFLSVLIVIMVALLFALNYFVATTSFGTWLSSLIGGII